MNIIFVGCLFVLTILLFDVNCTENSELTTGTAQLFSADPEDSTKYYVCVNGRLLKLTCAAGVQYTDVIKLKACNWPPNVNFDDLALKSVQPILKTAKKIVCYCKYPTRLIIDRI